VPHYRIYRLSNNRIAAAPEIVEYDSDRDVTVHAKKILDGADIEVWDGPRVVIRLKSPDAK